MAEISLDTEISELICTRISHDVIGNIGAVANAVELLEEGDLDFLDDISEILKRSSSTLSARMKFFRMAFGLNNANLENIELVEKTLKDYINTLGTISNNNVSITLSLIDEKFSKISLLLAMIVGDTFVRGGNLLIEQKGNKLNVISDNNLMVKDKVFIIKEVIRGNIKDALAQYAPILYLKKVLASKNYGLTLRDSENIELLVE